MKIKDNLFLNFLFVFLITYSGEMIFRSISGFDLVVWESFRIMISTGILALFITFVSQLFKRRGIRTFINLLYVSIYLIYVVLQLNFMNFLGVYISFNTSSQFGAVTDYIIDYIGHLKIIYAVILIPLIMTYLFYLKFLKKKEYVKNSISIHSVKYLVVLFVLCWFYFISLTIPFMQNKLQVEKNINLFRSPDVPTVAMNEFGTTMFGIIDLKSFLFPVEIVDEDYEPAKEAEKSTRQVSEALSYIAKNETNAKYENINNYFLSQPVTDFNEYTGMFEGKNVVVILMESVGEGIINKENFPNFYKLYSEGWHWVNNYSPRNSCATGNNEFSAMTSLFSIYNTCTSNVYKKNVYPEAIFNLFNNKGYSTMSMHDYIDWYYDRSVTHPNMGSMKYLDAEDLKLEYGSWPSDAIFFEKAFDIVLSSDNEQPFMLWLTTVTGHQPYYNNSTYGEYYKKDFKEKGYSTQVARYLSKIKVTDDAIGVMIDKLKEAGEWENTVIVMTGDHYPYGLNKNYIEEIVFHDLSDYDIEKTPFVIYNAEMEPKEFTEYTSYLNIVPTLANLMNLDYDPRFYVGTDLLSSDYESRVMFADGSWKNEKAFYNASTSKIKYYVEDFEYTPEEIQAVNKKVSEKNVMSSSAIKNNYFKYVYEKIDEYNELFNKPEEELVSEVPEVTVDTGEDETNKIESVTE